MPPSTCGINKQKPAVTSIRILDLFRKFVWCPFQRRCGVPSWSQPPW